MKLPRIPLEYQCSKSLSTLIYASGEFTSDVREDTIMCTKYIHEFSNLQNILNQNMLTSDDINIFLKIILKKLTKYVINKTTCRTMAEWILSEFLN